MLFPAYPDTIQRRFVYPNKLVFYPYKFTLTYLVLHC